MEGWGRWCYSQAVLYNEHAYLNWLENRTSSRTTFSFFAKRTHWSWQTPSSNNTREDSIHGHYQMSPDGQTLPGGQYRSQTDYIICSQRWRSSIQSAKTRLGADCGSDHELLIPKFRLKLKKVGKTPRPFRYELNHIPYDYTVEVRNRFKGLDLIECLMKYEWRFVSLCSRQGSRPSPKKRHAKKAKWLSE